MLSFPALAVAFSLISLVMSNALDEGAVCPLETVNTKRSPDGPHFVVYAGESQLDACCVQCLNDTIFRSVHG